MINDVTASAEGIYLTGQFSSWVDLDPGPAVVTHTCSGFGDVLIARLNNNMQHIWSTRLGGTGVDRGSNIRTNEGAVYLTGNFQGRMDFDPGPGFNEWYSVGSTDLFVLKLDTAGAYVKHGFMGGGNYALSYDMEISPDEKLWITGVYGGSFDFDPQSGTHMSTASGGEDMFLLRLNDQIGFDWMGSVSGIANENGRDITITSDGRIFVTGLFEVGADLDPGDYEYNVTSFGMADIYILQLNRYGYFVCATTIGGSGADGGVGIGLDVNNNVYISGFFSSNYSGNTDFDPSAATANLLSNGSTGDVFVASYMACGDFTGISENILNQNISVFPNPTNGKIEFKGVSFPAEVKIYEVNGRMISSSTVNEDGILNLESYPKGIYQVQMRDAQQNYSMRVVKE